MSAEVKLSARDRSALYVAVAAAKGKLVFPPSEQELKYMDAALRKIRRSALVGERPGKGKGTKDPHGIDSPDRGIVSRVHRSVGDQPGEDER